MLVQANSEEKQKYRNIGSVAISRNEPTRVRQCDPQQNSVRAAV